MVPRSPSTPLLDDPTATFSFLEGSTAGMAALSSSALRSARQALPKLGLAWRPKRWLAAGLWLCLGERERTGREGGAERGARGVEETRGMDAAGRGVSGMGI